MPKSVSELRKSARHCRELTLSTPAGGMRTELEAMAGEFCDEADKLERMAQSQRATEASS
jgi:hypothetical protein